MRAHQRPPRGRSTWKLREFTSRGDAYRRMRFRACTARGRNVELREFTSRSDAHRRMRAQRAPHGGEMQSNELVLVVERELVVEVVEVAAGTLAERERRLHLRVLVERRRGTAAELARLAPELGDRLVALLQLT